MNDILHAVIPVILVGGTGSRLASISSPECPKPFIPFADNSTLFMRTLNRCAMMAHPVVVGNAAHRDAIGNQARDVDATLAATLLEAQPQNTAFAVALAVAWMQPTTTQDAVLAILPADHAVEDADAWRSSIADAVQKATQQDMLILVGIVPSAGSSAYGYIDADTAGCVRAFREKPEDAAALCAQGWMWNSGQVIARISVLAAAIARHAPQLWQAAQQAIAGAAVQGAYVQCAGLEVDAVPFDCAVLERAHNLLMIVCDCGWSDVGTPEAFRHHAGLGETALPNQRIDRPWGYGVLIGRTAQTQSKELVIYPHKRISLQRHAGRDEHWSVMEGHAEVTLGESVLQLRTGDAVLVPRGVWHRLSNVGEGILRVHEVQSGSPDEADIERAEDDYGRV